MQSEFFRGYMQELVKHQYLLASMTSEVGTFGETRTSVCAVERQGGRFTLNKDATTGSYCQHADAILVTARRDKDASGGGRGRGRGGGRGAGRARAGGGDTM